MRRPLILLWLLCVFFGVAGCAVDSVRVISRDNDDFDIAEPAENTEGEYVWSDGAYYMSIHQMKKLFNPGWLLRTVRILGPVEAENVNSLDEVPDSTWFSNRHGVRRMTREELLRGPERGKPPGKKWTVVSGKAVGINPGFVARDEEGTLLFVKFDPAEYPGMGTNADVIASRFLHAAGYNVPEYHMVRVDPTSVTVRQGAEIQGKYKVKRPMVQEDLDRLFANAPRDTEGRIIANLSIGLSGKPKGPFRFEGTRGDDPNDTVLHENRRELRGLGIFMAWLNNPDTRQGNTLDMYVEEKGRRFLRHYVMDFSTSLGSYDLYPKESYHGHMYIIDPPVILQSLATLGLWIYAWETKPGKVLPSLGYFESETFDPDTWRSDYANPAFERLTIRDAFWAAKIITSFTDEDIRTIVSKGYFPEPEAHEYLVETLIKRRNIIGRRYFDTHKINPLDRFTVTIAAEGHYILRFVDLAVERGYADGGPSRYRYQVGGDSAIVVDPAIPLPPISSLTEVSIQTSRDGESWGRTASVLIDPSDGKPSVVRISR